MQVMGGMHSYNFADLGLRSVKYELLGFPLSILLACRRSKATYRSSATELPSSVKGRLQPWKPLCDLQVPWLVEATAVAEVILKIISSSVLQHHRWPLVKSELF